MPYWIDIYHYLNIVTIFYFQCNRMQMSAAREKNNVIMTNVINYIHKPGYKSIYRDKNRTPSLNIQFHNIKCYIAYWKIR